MCKFSFEINSTKSEGLSRGHELSSQWYPGLHASFWQLKSPSSQSHSSGSSFLGQKYVLHGASSLPSSPLSASQQWSGSQSPLWSLTQSRVRVCFRMKNIISLLIFTLNLFVILLSLTLFRFRKFLYKRSRLPKYSSYKLDTLQDYSQLALCHPRNIHLGRYIF